MGMFVSCIFIVTSAVFAIMIIDISAESYHKAESACVSLNSHVKSWDINTATCENSAKIDYVEYHDRKEKEPCLNQRIF